MSHDALSGIGSTPLNGVSTAAPPPPTRRATEVEPASAEQAAAAHAAALVPLVISIPTEALSSAMVAELIGLHSSL